VPGLGYKFVEYRRERSDEAAAGRGESA